MRTKSVKIVDSDQERGEPCNAKSIVWIAEIAKENIVTKRLREKGLSLKKSHFC